VKIYTKNLPGFILYFSKVGGMAMPRLGQGLVLADGQISDRGSLKRPEVKA
jgi:hypothetical protein